MLWEGPAARAYSALFGRWLKVTSVYSMLYGRQGAAANTGRVSVAIGKLYKAGYLASAKHPSTTWRLYTATFRPVVEDAKAAGADFTDEEVSLLSDFFGCAQGKPVESASGGIISYDRDAFLPPLCQARSALGSVVGLSLAYFSSSSLEGRRMSQYLTALKGALEGQAELPSNNNFGGLATKLSLQARTQVRSGKPAQGTLLYRLARYAGNQGALAEISDAMRAVSS